MRTWIERFPVKEYFGADINIRVKRMKRAGWQMTVLLPPDQSYVIVLGCQP